MALIRCGLPISPGFSYVSIGRQGLSLLCTVPLPACAKELLLWVEGLPKEEAIEEEHLGLRV